MGTGCLVDLPKCKARNLEENEFATDHAENEQLAFLTEGGTRWPTRQPQLLNKLPAAEIPEESRVSLAVENHFVFEDGELDGVATGKPPHGHRPLELQRFLLDRIVLSFFSNLTLLHIELQSSIIALDRGLKDIAVPSSNQQQRWYISSVILLTTMVQVDALRGTIAVTRQVTVDKQTSQVNLGNAVHFCVPYPHHFVFASSNKYNLIAE